MKIDYISDLHMGFVLDGKRTNKDKVITKINEFVESMLPEELGDVVVIAGDIDEYNHINLEVLESFARFYERVYVVFGNHDLYLVSANHKQKYHHNSYNKQEELKKMVNVSTVKDRIRLLDNTLETYKGVTFAGTSLWYTLPLEYDKMWWGKNSNDSRYIYPTGVIATEERHKRDLDFYQSLDNAKVDVLITHVPPIHLYKTHKPSASYHNVAISHLGLYAPHWICGHQHVRTVVKVNDTTIYNNSAGYVGEFKDEPKLKSFIL